MDISSGKRVIQLTGFRDRERESLIEQLFKLDCIYVDSEKFENCTHLISKKPCRSEKWLAACASGKWVLTKDYIINSVQSGRWLDETTYEWGYKIEKHPLYSSLMQSAPKRWREHLTHTGVEGAFKTWKVVVLVNRSSKQRESFVRVLKAGQAVLCNQEDPDEVVTHVFVKSNFQTNQPLEAPYYCLQYLGTYLLEEPVEGASKEMTEEQINGIKHIIWKRFCFAQARDRQCVIEHITFNQRLTGKYVDNDQASLNRIEGLIEGQFFIEAFGELNDILPFLPPLQVLTSLIKHLLQGNIDVTCFGKFFDIFYNIVRFHPPWESLCMAQYYLDFLQCPLCKKGTWPFIEVLIRSFLNEKFYLCHSSSDLDIFPNKIEHNRQKLTAQLLKYVTSIIQKEAKSLSKRLCECPEFVQRTSLPPSLTVKIFWFEWKTTKLLTNQMCSLMDLVFNFHKARCRADEALLEEVSCSLKMMLSSAVEYWILLGFYLDRNLLYQVANDLAFYISFQCEDFSFEETKQFICSIPSPWIQMFVSDVIFKTMCSKRNLNIPPEPLSLEKLIYTYLPALCKVGTCGKELENLKRKRKIGRQPCQLSQKTVLMLYNENNYQGDVLLDLPVLPKRRRKSEGALVLSKENMLFPERERVLGCHNIKGETTLHTACRNNKVEKLVLLLRSHGTDINVKDNAGWTPLHEACNHGSIECVLEILQNCPDVDLLSDVDGVTPLHDALQNGHIEIGKKLLQYGGPTLLQCKDSDGNFPLDYIASPQLKNELFDVVQLNETIEDFHKHAAQEYDNRKIEFSAFLLSRMLLNFHSLYDLPANSHAAKTLCPNAAFISHTRSKETRISFTNSFVELYIENLVTLQKLHDFSQTFPDALRHSSESHLQKLLAVIHTLVAQ
ncbi:hypothetical protein GDO86_002235 [Hymenochirus boettgeri]|uniref:SMC5-SMC6 complex localization factor 1 n=1 Tax=Hymenochirus boettgeri TaxID=247094 RepID=A0A8T2KK51_9PIPI|nr:hypothetical protein GDO86_002235 [Hymenochirus boettgeri]